MSSFNWHDEETGWEVNDTQPEPEQPQSPQPSSKKLTVWMSVLALIALITAGTAAWWRIQSVENNLEADVLESWQLVISSEQNQDVELFTNQLSGRDEDWIRTQQHLLEDQKLSSRASILTSLDQASPGQIDFEPEIAFAPELTEATISHKVKYVDQWGRELTLIQDEIFRLGTDRWLLSPPSPEYWAADASEQTEKYSERFAYSAVSADIGVAEEIVSWIENRLNLLCIDGFFDACKTQQTPQTTIEFIPLMTEKMLNGSLQTGSNELVIQFPTPSLIGRPATDADTRLLAEAYGQIFFEKYLIVLMNQRGVETDPVIDAIVNFAVTQVGGLPPLTPNDYQRVWLDIDDVRTAFNQNRVVGEGTDNIRQFMDIPIRSTFRLMVEYRMQGPKWSPQLLIDDHLAVDTPPFFPELLLKAEEWDDFEGFVQTRAALAVAPVPSQGQQAAE